MTQPASPPTSSVRSTIGKAALIILLATIAGRALGLVRDTAIAYFFPPADTDAFFLAYRIPYLLTLTISGALTATFVPLFSYRLATDRRKEAWDLSVNVGNVITLVVVALSVILIVVAPWLIPLVGFGFVEETADKTVFLFQIMMIGFTFEVLAGLVISMLNSLKRFALAAFAPALGTIATLAITILFAKTLNITALAVGTVAGWILGCVVLFPGLRDQQIHYRPRINWHDSALREVGAMIFPILIGSSVGKVGIFVNQILASNLDEGSGSSLSYAEKFFQFPLGLFVAGIMVPIFPLLSEQVAANASDKVKDTVSFSLRLLGFMMVPITVGIILLRYPLIGLVLQHGKFGPEDTARTAMVLLFLCLGLYPYAGRDTFVRVFYAYHDAKTPVNISVATVVINCGLSYLLMKTPLGVGGLALGTTIALLINFVILIWLLRRKIGQMGLREIGFSLGRVLLVSAVMGIAVWAVDSCLAGVVSNTTGGNFIRVILGLVVGVAVFLISARLTKMPELAEVTDMLRVVLKRKKSSDLQEKHCD